MKPFTHNNCPKKCGDEAAYNFLLRSSSLVYSLNVRLTRKRFEKFLTLTFCQSIYFRVDSAGICIQMKAACFPAVNPWDLLNYHVRGTCFANCSLLSLFAAQSYFLLPRSFVSMKRTIDSKQQKQGLTLFLESNRNQWWQFRSSTL
ncbi:hypothetical protein Tcan_00755, partial [Toxocara canis]